MRVGRRLTRQCHQQKQVASPRVSERNTLCTLPISWTKNAIASHSPPQCSNRPNTSIDISIASPPPPPLNVNVNDDDPTSSLFVDIPHVLSQHQHQHQFDIPSNTINVHSILYVDTTAHPNYSSLVLCTPQMNRTSSTHTAVFSTSSVAHSTNSSSTTSPLDCRSPSPYVLRTPPLTPSTPNAWLSSLVPDFLGSSLLQALRPSAQLQLAAETEHHPLLPDYQYMQTIQRGRMTEECRQEWFLFMCEVTLSVITFYWYSFPS